MEYHWHYFHEIIKEHKQQTKQENTISIAEQTTDKFRILAVNNHIIE